MPDPITERAISMIEEAGLACTAMEKEFLSQSHAENKDRFFVVASELYSSKRLFKKWS